MALVFMGSHGWGTLFIDPSDIEAGVGLQSSFTNPADATAATHYADSAGSSPSTGPVTADANGRLTRWIEEGTYTQTLPGGSTVEVHAVSGATLASVESNVTAIEDITRVTVAATGVAATDRANLNATLTTGKNVEIRAGDYLIDTPLLPPGGQKIRLREGAVIKASTSFSGVAIIDLTDKTDVTVEGGKIDGDRANNALGNIVAGILVRGAAQRIRIYRTHIVNIPGQTAVGGAAGDGVYIGGSSSNTPNDVRVRDVVVDNCVRQGVSITRGENIRIVGCTFKNIAGTDPGAGVDIEPNNGTDVCRDIQIIGNTVDTACRGISLALPVGSSEDLQGEIIIAHNRIRNMVSAVTTFDKGNGITVANCRESVKVHDNIVMDCDACGIHIDQGVDGDVQDNTVRDCAINAIRISGILRFTVKENRVRHNSAAGTGSGAAILIDPGGTGGVNGNHVQLGATALAGVRSDAATGVSIRGNDIFGDSVATGIGINIVGGDNHNVTGNTVYTALRGINLASNATGNLIANNTLGTCATPYLDGSGGTNVNYFENNDVGTTGYTNEVASAATITLPAGRRVRITGTTNITSITAMQRDTLKTLHFDGALTVTDGSNLKLAGNFVTTAGDTLTLISDGVNWAEGSRSGDI